MKSFLFNIGEILKRDRELVLFIYKSSLRNTWTARWLRMDGRAQKSKRISMGGVLCQLKRGSTRRTVDITVLRDVKADWCVVENGKRINQSKYEITI